MKSPTRKRGRRRIRTVGVNSLHYQDSAWRQREEKHASKNPGMYLPAVIEIVSNASNPEEKKSIKMQNIKGFNYPGKHSGKGQRGKLMARSANSGHGVNSPLQRERPWSVNGDQDLSLSPSTIRGASVVHDETDLSYATSAIHDLGQSNVDSTLRNVHENGDVAELWASLRSSRLSGRWISELENRPFINAKNKNIHIDDTISRLSADDFLVKGSNSWDSEDVDCNRSYGDEVSIHKRMSLLSFDDIKL